MIRKGKDCYRRKMEHQLQQNNICGVWKGLKTISGFKEPKSQPVGDQGQYQGPKGDTGSSEPIGVAGLVGVCGAKGPDGIPGRVLRACSGELAEVLTDIFNLSLAHAVVPTCFKSTSIIPVPKNSKPSSLNDYRPVALTPIITKCFERLVLAHLKSCLPPTLDPHQFAYRQNRSTEDAVSIALHSVLSHLDNKNTYTRLLFIDFSSAFNTVIPSKLITKLTDLGISSLMCNWLLDFLTSRPQHVLSG
ncbi:hypothetical protein L3Q82_023513 [Scortum barcoo]|uniref:Uncharacterized protein n=1 Tax=Scortum barcoo TaxID=214431 RepID=A0ACB8WTY3_9TELE|nr:hypothetical protein L3Q82_023513 [Scortum barcoo]